MADREQFKLARPYCQTQGFDRFVEGGMEQIDEVVIGGIPIEPPADQPTAKFVGLSKVRPSRHLWRRLLPRHHALLHRLH